MTRNVRTSALKLFFDKLSARVLNFTGHGGYIDRTDIQPGDTWPETLATALNNSQPLVCLYSASYLALTS